MKLTADHVAALADLAAQKATWNRRAPTHALLDLRHGGLVAFQRVSRARPRPWSRGLARPPTMLTVRITTAGRDALEAARRAEAS